MVHGLFRASGIVMIYRCHHAQARRRQVRMPGSLLESTGGSIFPSAEALAALVEELAGPGGRIVLPELLKGFLEKVSPDSLQVVAEEITEPEVLRLEERRV